MAGKPATRRRGRPEMRSRSACSPRPRTFLPAPAAGVLRGPVNPRSKGARRSAPRGPTTWRPTPPARASCSRATPTTAAAVHTTSRGSSCGRDLHQRAFPQIEAGTADYTDLALSSSTTLTALASRLAARYGSGSAAAAQEAAYFVNPGLQLDFFFLNTIGRCSATYACAKRSTTRSTGARSPTWRRLPVGARATSRPLPAAGDARLSRRPRLSDASGQQWKPQSSSGRPTEAAGRPSFLTCEGFPCPQQAQIVKTDLAARSASGSGSHRLPLDKLFAREQTPAKSFDLAWEGSVTRLPRS